MVIWASPLADECSLWDEEQERAELPCHVGTVNYPSRPATAGAPDGPSPTLSDPPLDLQTARLLRLLPCDVAHGLSEAPDVAFWILCRIRAVTVELIRGLSNYRRACRPGTSAVGVEP